MRVTKRVWRVWQRFSRSRPPFSPLSEQREDRSGRTERSEARLQAGYGRETALDEPGIFASFEREAPTASVEISWDGSALENNSVAEKRERREDSCGPTADEPSNLSRKRVP